MRLYWDGRLWSAIGRSPWEEERKTLSHAAPFLNSSQRKSFTLGIRGSGNKVKLLNQLMFGAINAMTAEMMAISEKIGISPKILFGSINSSQAATVNNLFKERGGRIAAENYENPTFTVNLLIKDVHLAVEMAKAGDAPPLLGRTVELINEFARAQGFCKNDTSIMWKSLQKVWGD